MDTSKYTAPEEWRSLAPQGASQYEVSSYGRVRSLLHYDADTGAPLVLQPSLTRGGYPVVELACDDGRARVVLVHRLVCWAWHGPQPSLDHVVGHLGDVKTDNRPESLAWITRSENLRQSYANGGRLPPRPRGPLSDATVRAIRLRMNSGESVAKIAHDLGLSRGVCRRAALGQTYRWVGATLAESERLRRAEETRRAEALARRRAEVDELELLGLERAAAPEGQRRRRTPHTPTVRPKSRAK